MTDLSIEFKMLNDFLNKHRRSKDDTEKATHTRMPNDISSGGSFIIKDDVGIFWELYHSVYNKQNEPLSLTELPMKSSPIRVDVDMKFPLNDHDQFADVRKYSDIDIEQIIEIYESVMKKYLTLDDYDIKTYVFEKGKKMRKMKDHIKDGIHMIFTMMINDNEQYLLVDNETQKFIHQQASKEIENEFDHLKSEMSQFKLIDDVTTNPWLILGSCKKEDTEKYSLTRIYYESRNIINNVDTSLLNPRFFSIRIQDEPTIFLKENAIPIEDPIEFYVSILNKNRCDEYDSWLRVCICLKNIDEKYKELFIKWSSQSEKFNRHSCEKKWQEIKIDSRDERNRLKLGSLRAWAKRDNPEKYIEYNQNRIFDQLEKDVNMDMNELSLTDGDIASMFYKEYNSVVKFKKGKQTKDNEWYIFNDNRWKKYHDIDDIAEFCISLQNTYKRILERILETSSTVSDDKKKEIEKKKIRPLNKIIYKLNTSMLWGQVKQALPQIPDLRKDNEHFNPNNEFDKKYNLISFTNGVYDLNTHKFRPGEFDDFTTKNTNIEYKHSDPVLFQELIEFFEKILPNKKVRDFVLMDLASMLHSDKENAQRFRVWIGEGANGKSTLNSLIENTFGCTDNGYIGTCNSTLLTRKKQDSANANPELYQNLHNNKRIVLLQEPDKNDKLNADFMKELAGRDTQTCRNLFKETEIFRKPSCRWILSCNHFPRVYGTDYSIWRRFSVIEFPSKFKLSHEKIEDPTTEFYRDSSVEVKVQHEWCIEFFHLLMIYYKQWEQNKYETIQPYEVTRFTEMYQKKFDLLKQFIEDSLETCRENDSVPISKREFNSLFKEWCTQSNQEKPSAQDLDEYYNSKHLKKNKKGIINYKIKGEEDERTNIVL